jgi:hypothetical protein
MAVMYDAVNVAAIPADAAIVAGYVDGNYQTVPALQARFPQATIVEITVTGRPGVRVCDCETGDLTPAQAAAWATAEISAGRRPTIYCNLSTWPAARTLLADRAGQVDWWVAEYDGDPAIPAGAVAKQYQSTDYDISSTVDGWPAAHTQPTAPPKETDMPDPSGKLAAPIRAVCDRPNHPGQGWRFAADGGVFPYGGAPMFGNPAGDKLAAPVVGAAVAENGYTLIGSDGGSFPYGPEAPNVPSLA